MARKQIVELVDDIDGGEATETVKFGYAGATYEIDLNDKNAAALEKALAPFLAAGRRTSRSTAGRPSSTSGRASSTASGTSRDYDASVVRAWAKQQGLDVSERGRVSKDIVEQWRSAS